MEEASALTLRILLPSMTTTALVHSLPLASHSLPKRTALSALAEGFSCPEKGSATANMVAKINRLNRTKLSSRRHTWCVRCRQTSKSVGEGKQWRFVAELVAVGGLRGSRGSGRGSRRRHGRGDSGSMRAEPEFLQGQGVELAGGIQAVARLEFLHALDGGIVPLSVGGAGKGAVLGEGLLNLGNAVGSGSFLPPLPPGMLVGLSGVWLAAGSGPGRLACRAPGLRWT